MKLIIDIPEDVYKKTVFYREFKDLNDCVTTIKALEKATPLDKIRAEIEQIYQEIDTISHNEYENAVEQGKECAYENVLDIIDKYTKGE